MTTNTFDIEKFAKEIGFTFIGRGSKIGTIAVRCDKCLEKKEIRKYSFKLRKGLYCNDCKSLEYIDKVKEKGFKNGFKYIRNSGMIENNKSKKELHYWLCLRCNKEHLYSFKAMEAKKEKDCRECNKKDLHDPFKDICTDKGFVFKKIVKTNKNKRQSMEVQCICKKCNDIKQIAKKELKKQAGLYCGSCRSTSEKHSFYIFEIIDGDFSFIKFGISQSISYRHPKRVEKATYKLLYSLEYGKKEETEYIETQLKQMFNKNGFKLKNQKQTSKYLNGGFTETYSTKFREEIVRALRTLEKGIETTEKEYDLFLDFHKNLKDKGWKFLGRVYSSEKSEFQCLSCNEKHSFFIGAMNKRKTKYCSNCQSKQTLKDLKDHSIKIGFSFIEKTSDKDKKNNLLYDFKCNKCNTIKKFSRAKFLNKKNNYCKSCQDNQILEKFKNEGKEKGLIYLGKDKTKMHKSTFYNLYLCERCSKEISLLSTKVRQRKKKYCGNCK